MGHRTVDTGEQDTDFLLLKGLMPLTSALFKGQLYSTHFVYPFIHQQMSCFHLVAVINNAVTNIYVQISVKSSFQFLRYIPRNGIASLCANYVYTF